MTAYGARLLPQALDNHALLTPDRLYASIPKDNEIHHGFQDISCKDMARCVNQMASWIVEHFGQNYSFETVTYIGIPDLRSVAVFLGAVKAGYKVLLPSPRNPPATNLALMDQTNSVKLLHAAEVTPVVKLIIAGNDGIVARSISSFNEMMNSDPEYFLYAKEFEYAKDDPIVVLHSSGSTGIPKPITMTHATFAVLDNERHLPTVPGRKNRDYSVWDIKGGGRFYTVFPYFHLAGFLSLVVNPIFTESSSPVLGPPLMPPSGSLLKEVMRHQKLRALYLPPSIAEQLLLEPEGIDFFKGLDFFCYTGAPFSPEAGKQLSKVTELCPLYGSTEAFQVPQLAPASPEDWAWMEWNPCFQVEMQPCDDEEGTFELVLFANEHTERISALNHNLPGVCEYRTRDLFKQHSTKLGLWQYYGRRDDIIVLSNGEKFNPVPMELRIQGNADLSGALVIGMGRVQAALVLELKPTNQEKGRAVLLARIWPVIEEANQLVPAQGRIMRNRVLLSSLEKPFVRAGKGTVVRKLTERLYQPEIDRLYSTEDDIAAQQFPILQLELKPSYEPSAIIEFVRAVFVDVLPEVRTITDEDDLFSNGLDSIKINQAIGRLKASLRANRPSEDLSWINTRIIYQNPSVNALARLLHSFLNCEKITDDHGKLTRAVLMQELLRRYTEDLPKPGDASSTTAHTSVVAVIGSTGYLGPHIVVALLERSDLTTIYCLNRGPNAEQRTISALPRSKDIPEKDLQKLHFITADLGKSHFGLDQGQYDLLKSTVDVYVFNSWNPNFSLPLQSFEKPFLPGLRTVIELSASSRQRPKIVFVSSIAAIGEWPRVHPDQPMIPEESASDNDVALHMGYGESKCIAEQILAQASEISGVSVAIVRAGQIGGHSNPASSSWPLQGWLWSLVKTSKSLGILPTRVSPLDWIPVDAFASAIANIAQNHADNGTQIFNLVHPNPGTWDLFLNVLRRHYGLQAEDVSLPEWLDRVEALAEEDSSKRAIPHGLKIFDFLRSLGPGREGDMKCITDNAASVLKDVAPLNEELMVDWLKGWNLRLSDTKGKM